jgi:hypothetical protein
MSWVGVLKEDAFKKKKTPEDLSTFRTSVFYDEGQPQNASALP